MLLALLPLVQAHGGSFGAAAVSVSRDDPDEIWLLTEGWGLAHSTDGGAEWEWLCEESIGGEEVYAVLAAGSSTATIATRAGIRQVGAGCDAAVSPGTEGTFFSALASWGTDILALGIGTDEGGVWRCSPTSPDTAPDCTPTELHGPGLFPKSIRVDGTRAWVTVVQEETLASALWWTEDGTNWTEAHAWPDGDTDPRVLSADGDRLLVWRRTRADKDVPGLLVSEDGGASFHTTLETGFYTDAAPALLDLGDALLLGSIAGARTWRSEDVGETWAEVSTDVPAVRCADTVEGQGYACGDHLQDGFDLARTADGRTWYPLACLEEALPSACADGTCGPLLSAWQAAGSYGGGQCDTVVRPPAGTPADTGCGCGGAHAAALPLLLAWAPVRRRRRSGRYSPSRK